MRLLLIRHGQTAWNAAGRYQGRTDVPLDETGRAEARALAAALADEPVTRLLCSPLERARDTAAPLGLAWGVEPELDADLLEMDFGAWEGLTGEDIVAGDATAYAAWQADAEHLAPPGGETLAQVHARVVRLYERLRRGPDEVVALVAHVSPLKLLMLHLLDLPPDQHRRFHLPRGSLSVVEVAPGGPVLHCFGQTYAA